MSYWQKQPSSRYLLGQALQYGGSSSVPSTNFSPETFQIRVTSNISRLARFRTRLDLRHDARGHGPEQRHLYRRQCSARIYRSGAWHHGRLYLDQYIERLRIYN